MKRQQLDLLNDISLIWTCIEPTIQLVRGKPFAAKSEVYAQLTSGQRALLMFQMLYGHANNGVEGFYSHLSYLLSNKGVWSELKKGIYYFGDYSMMKLLEEMDTVYQRFETLKFQESLENKDSELITSISRIDLMLRELLPETIKLVGAYIRNNSNEFIQFET